MILPELEKGRPNVDKPHTQAVAYHLKRIIESNPGLNLDLSVLLIAAYAHDWGYSGLFENGKLLQMGDVAGAKEQHMMLGVEKLKALLENDFFSFLTKQQKERITHLVAVHDKLDQLKDKDELVLMEADTLGGLDCNFWKPRFDPESNDKYMQGVKNKRRPLFISDYGKEEFEKLYKLRQEYYKQRRYKDLEEVRTSSITSS